MAAPGTTSSSFFDEGFTLIELVLVMLLVTILGGLVLSGMKPRTDAQRYESTRQELDAIRIAIVGDSSLNPDGHRTSFGYVGDWGSLPSSLSNLTTAQTPAWSFNTTYGVGAGWKGPYLMTTYTGIDPTLDAWQNAFIYAPAASPPTVTSYGADGAQGGTVFGVDIVLPLPTNTWQGAVSGLVLSGTTPHSGDTVEIRYPVNGVLTAFTTTTASDGSFSFSNVPFGVRSIRVTSPTALGPFPLVVDSPQVQVPPVTLNFGPTAAATGVTVATLWHDEDTILTGNGFSYGTDFSEPFHSDVYQNTASNGDSFQQSFTLGQGTYTFNVLAEQDATSGKVDWYLDGTLFKSGQDWYASSTQYGVTQSTTVTVTSTGTHTLKGVINGKNGSSSSYYFRGTKAWLTQ